MLGGSARGAAPQHGAGGARLLIPYVKGSLIKGSLWWIGIFTAVALVIQATVVGVLGDFGAMELFP